jgi:hypothetical protein
MSKPVLGSNNICGHLKDPDVDLKHQPAAQLHYDIKAVFPSAVRRLGSHRGTQTGLFAALGQFAFDKFPNGSCGFVTFGK